MLSGWQWIIILVILAIVRILSPDKYESKDYDCYDKSPYKRGKCRKNCRWKYIIKNFEEFEKESEYD